MRKRRLAILHFHPLEQYPPVMNLIKSMDSVSGLETIVCTTKKKSSWQFQPEKAEVNQFGKQSSGPWQRYICYSLFNLFSFLRLVIFRPSSILYYESYSCFPALLYKRLFPGVRLFIHYHEYNSPPEREQASGYLRWLYRMEQKRYGKAEWISHTNEDRMRLFTEEKPGLPKAALNVLPNYPPFSWYHLKKNPVLDEGQTKVVYVGALSMHTMYTREFAAWIVEQQGRYTWDIFSDNCSQEVKDFLKALNCRFISLNPAVAYHQLPALLRQYSVGVVLYNGHIPNYVYNVPNKVLEYYACGLEVWCSHDLASTVDFKKRHQLDSIRIIDFTTEKKGDVESNSKTDDKKTGSYRKIFSSEDVYSKLMERMIA